MLEEKSQFCQQLTSHDRCAGENAEGIEAGCEGDSSSRRKANPFGRGEKDRREAERLDYNEQRDEGRHGIIERRQGNLPMARLLILDSTIGALRRSFWLPVVPLSGGEIKEQDTTKGFTPHRRNVTEQGFFCFVG